MQNYELFEKIGQGGMGSVYRARHTQLHRDVAIKFMDAAIAHDSVAVERFLREARLLAKIDHPNVVRVYDMGVDEKGQPFIAMELLTGISLNDQLRKGPLSEADAVEVAGQLLLALDEAHRNGIVHRDIKSSNITLLPNRTVKLLDFGIARDAMLSSVTSTGRIIGTPAYMSPEQAEGVPATPQSDLYSLGIVLYEMLTGQVPFRAETPLSVLRMHTDVRPPELPNQFSPHVRQTILRALEKRPEMRFPNARAMLDALMARAPSNAYATPPPAAYSTPPMSTPYPESGATRSISQPQAKSSGGSAESVIGIICGVIGIPSFFCPPVGAVFSLFGMIMGFVGKKKRQGSAWFAIILNVVVLLGGGAFWGYVWMNADDLMKDPMNAVTDSVTSVGVEFQLAAFIGIKSTNDLEKESALNSAGLSGLLLPAGLTTRTGILNSIQKLDEAVQIEKKIDEREDLQIKQVLKDARETAGSNEDAKDMVDEFEQAIGNPDVSGSATDKSRKLRDQFYSAVRQYLEFLLARIGKFRLLPSGDNFEFDYGIGTQAVNDFNAIKNSLTRLAQERLDHEAARTQALTDTVGLD